MQLMNVALGGTLHQHLPELVGDERHAHHGHCDPDVDRDVRLADSSLAARAAGARTLRATSSRHHQGVGRIAPPLVASGWTADQLPVALEAPALRFFLGVQWHPEADHASPIVAAFVAAARAAPAKPR